MSGCKIAIIDFLGFNHAGVNEDPSKWEIDKSLPCGAVVLKDSETERSKSVRVQAGSVQLRYSNIGESITNKVETLARNGLIPKQRRSYKNDQIYARSVRIKDLTESECEVLMKLERKPDGTYQNYWFDAQADRSEYYPLTTAREAFHSMVTSKQRSAPELWIENHWAYVYEFLI